MFFLHEFEPMFMCIVVALKSIFFTTSMEIIFYKSKTSESLFKTV